MQKETYDRIKREDPQFKDRNNEMIKRCTSEIYLNLLKYMKEQMRSNAYYWLNRHMWDIREELVNQYLNMQSYWDMQEYINGGNEPYTWEITTHRLTKLLKITHAGVFTIGTFRKYSSKHKSSRPFLTGVFNG